MERYSGDYTGEWTSAEGHGQNHSVNQTADDDFTYSTHRAVPRPFEEVSLQSETFPAATTASANFPTAREENDLTAEPQLPCLSPQNVRGAATATETFPSSKNNKTVAFQLAGGERDPSWNTHTPLSKAILEGAGRATGQGHEDRTEGSCSSTGPSKEVASANTEETASTLDGGSIYAIEDHRNAQGGKGDAANPEHEQDFDESSTLTDSDSSDGDLLMWMKHTVSTPRFQLHTAALVLGVCLVSAGFIWDAEESRYRVGKFSEDDLFASQLLKFSGTTFITFTLCSFLNWLFHLVASYTLGTKYWTTSMYIVALDGPVRDILFTSMLWVIWRLFLPAFGAVKNQLLVLLSLVSSCNLVKEVLLIVIQRQTVKNEFEAALEGVIERMVTLQNISMLAKCLYRIQQNKKHRPTAKSNRPHDNEEISEYSNHCDYDSSNASDESPTMLTDVCNNDPSLQLRSIHEKENRFSRLEREVQGGKFELFNGEGEVVSVSNAVLARKVASSIFSRLDANKDGVLSISDLASLPGVRITEDEAEELIAKMGYRVDRQITRRGFIMYSHKVYADLRNIGLTLKNFTGITRAFRVVMNVLLSVVSLAAGLLLFKVSVMKVLIPAATLLIALSFMLGSAANHYFQGLMFLLVWRPFNVGDRVRIDDSAPMFVHKLTIYFTEFKRFDGSTESRANHVLIRSIVRNEVRAEFAVVEIPIKIGYRTSSLQLDMLTSAVIQWIRQRRHVWKEDYIEFYIYDISVNEHMEIAFWFGHRFTLQHGGAVWGDISKLRLYLVETMIRLGMECIKAAQPVYLGSREEIASSLPPSQQKRPSFSGTQQGRHPSNLFVDKANTCKGGEFSRENPIFPADRHTLSGERPSNTSEEFYELAENSRREKNGYSSAERQFSSGKTIQLNKNGQAQQEAQANAVVNGLLRPDSNRERKLTSFDINAHAANFIDIRTGGVHHTWNWVAPLRQRCTVFTSPELIEKLLRSKKIADYDENLLKGAGYGLSLKYKRRKHQKSLGSDSVNE